LLLHEVGGTTGSVSERGDLVDVFLLEPALSDGAKIEIPKTAGAGMVGEIPVSGTAPRLPGESSTLDRRLLWVGFERPAGGRLGSAWGDVPGPVRAGSNDSSTEEEGCCEDPVGVLRLPYAEASTFLDCGWVLRGSVCLSADVRRFTIGGDLGALGGYWDESTEGDPDVGFG
jgi:hypothetical protein